MFGLRRRLEPVALARIAAARWSELAAYVAAASACLLFSRFALERHARFESDAYDLGFFDQIIWNTSHGRWFQTSFTPYNFLGQHFQPVLLIFALAYRLGGGIELLLITQTLFVAAAALPLFYAVRRATASGAAGLAVSLAFLFSTQLHHALDFDFHPELMGFFFVFLALYYLVARRPVACVVSLLPLLLLKEDMPLLLGAFAVLLLARGFRREGLALFTIAAAYAAAVVLVLMPWIRGSSGDLTERYGYLVAGSDVWSLAPHIISRAVGQLWRAPLAAGLRLIASTGFAGLLSPIALLVAIPAFLLAALSDHPQQSRLELHYVMAPLALAWVAATLGLERIAGGKVPRVALTPQRRRTASGVAAAIVLVSSVTTFALWSPYSPRAARYAPGAAHRDAITQALALVPREASVSAQHTLLPHLSRRQDIFEFPDLHGAGYVIVDPSLPVTRQTIDAGYADAIAALRSRGYDLLFDRDGVRVYRRTQGPLRRSSLRSTRNARSRASCRTFRATSSTRSSSSTTEAPIVRPMWREPPAQPSSSSRSAATGRR